MKNYYEILGIPDTATLDEIRKAYRKLSKKFHPDKNDGDPFFENKFKEINEAYEVLSNPEKRTAYNATYKFNQNQQQAQETFKRQQEAAYQKFKQEEERLRREKEAFEKAKQAYNTANAQRTNNTPQPPPVSQPAPQPNAQAASNQVPIFVIAVVAILIVIGFLISKNHDGQIGTGTTITEVPTPSPIQIQDSVLTTQYPDTTETQAKAIESQSSTVASTPIHFNGSDYNDLLAQINNRFEQILNSASLSNFQQDKALPEKLSLSQLKELYLIAFRKNQKDDIILRFGELASIFYMGNINPGCIDQKGKLLKLEPNTSCMNFDDQFNFDPDYEIARMCSEAINALGGIHDIRDIGNIGAKRRKYDLYYDLYGNGYDPEYLKAYDAITIAGQRGDKYYELHINVMTQTLMDPSRETIEYSGSLSQNVKSKIHSIQPNIGYIGRTLTRTQFENLLSTIDN